jgi:two-component system OmpR family response regulator
MIATVNTRTPRILVVDDEPSILETVSGVLRDEGFEIETASTARSAMSTAVACRPDMIVLDVMLPDFDGIEIARRLRADGHALAILFLTARDSVEDRISGLRIGGDDYMTKPFSLEELVERVRAILRRTRAVVADPSVIVAGDLTIDVTTHEVWRNHTAVHLTATEFHLLHYFARNPRLVLSKTQILAAVWPDDVAVDENVVETFVSYLRKKLDRLGPSILHTVRLVGYSFRPIFD